MIHSRLVLLVFLMTKICLLQSFFIKIIKWLGDIDKHARHEDNGLIDDNVMLANTI